MATWLPALLVSHEVVGAENPAIALGHEDLSLAAGPIGKRVGLGDIGIDRIGIARAKDRHQDRGDLRVVRLRRRADRGRLARIAAERLKSGERTIRILFRHEDMIVIEPGDDVAGDPFAGQRVSDRRRQPDSVKRRGHVQRDLPHYGTGRRAEFGRHLHGQDQ